MQAGRHLSRPARIGVVLTGLLVFAKGPILNLKRHKGWLGLTQVTAFQVLVKEVLQYHPKNLVVQSRN